MVNPSQLCDSLVCAFLCSLCFFWKGCCAQMLSPLAGQGYTPGQGRNIGLQFLNKSTFANANALSNFVFTPVYVSCYLDNLLKVNDQEYRFEAVIFMRLSWDDPRAYGEIVRRTNETYIAGKDEDCKRPCRAQYHQCCDTVWLPGLDLVNVWGLPQERVDYEIINVNIMNTTNVFWTRRFNGIFYTPMNFRRFPFDCQVLVIEFWGQSCCHDLRASSVSTRILTRSRRGNKAADLSSWRVTNLSLETFQFNISDLMDGGTPSNPDEPWAIKPDLVVPRADPAGNECVFPYPDSLRIYISVERLSWYYVISYQIPMILCVLVSWWTFLIRPQSIETRMAVLVSLFLSLTALQFIISNQLPASSYITVMGWIVVASYFLIVLATAETMLVYCVFRWYVHGRDKLCNTCESSTVRDGDPSVSHHRSLRTGDDGSVLGPLDSTEEKEHERGEAMASSGVHSGQQVERNREQDRSTLPRWLTGKGVDMRRLMSTNPLKSTIDVTRRIDSSLRRDLRKANNVISKIEKLSICTFPLLYALLLGIIFAFIH